MFPPGEEIYFKDKFGNLVYDIESEELKNSNIYPEFNDKVKYYELIQGPGEAVFVPSGWHHQVWNLVIFILNYYTKHILVCIYRPLLRYLVQCLFY